MKKAALIFVIFLFAFLQVNAQKHAITPEELWQMQRIGAMDISPDGTTLAFQVTTYSMDENKGQSDIYLINIDGTNLRPLKNSEVSESSPKFSPDGKTIAYNYKGQIWLSDYEGNNDKQLTDIYTGASGLVWAKDGKSFLFTSLVWPDCPDMQCNEDKDTDVAEDPVEVMIFDELMYRHWDDWRGPKRSHLFLKDLEKDESYDLTLFSNFDVPVLALGSANDYSMSPCGKEIAFTMNTDDMLATSTNNDIFTLKLADFKKGEKNTYTKISASGGNDNQPVYSPCGKYIAFCSMERAGFEADKQRLMIYNRESGELKCVSDNLDISFGQLVWSPDAKYIYYTTTHEIYDVINKIEVATGNNETIIGSRSNSSILLSPDGIKLYFKQQRSTQPHEIFSADADGSNLKQLSFVNKELLANLEMNEIENFWSEGAGGTPVQSILVKPPFFDSTKKYPMIFLIHGGPQGGWTDDFHYRWNLQMFASRGYVVVAVNPRGSVGYGQKFTDEISKDWGGKVYIDLMNTLDYAIANYNFIDSKNIFAAGASYGGYMINWIEGHTDRFTALVCHDGVFNLESMWGTTEELWFPEWEMGGTPWESRDLYVKWSPHQFVQNFKTPMLVVHGGMDFRVPEGQAFELFSSLQRMGVKSKFIYFPKETHFVTKPQNARFWWNSIFEWYEENKVR